MDSTSKTSKLSVRKITKLKGSTFRKRCFERLSNYTADKGRATKQDDTEVDSCAKNRQRLLRRGMPIK